MCGVPVPFILLEILFVGTRIERSGLYKLYHQSVVSKGRSFTASPGTRIAVLPKAGLPPQTQEPRLQF